MSINLFKNICTFNYFKVIKSTFHIFILKDRIKSHLLLFLLSNPNHRFLNEERFIIFFKVYILNN